jgi:hypothetical protein
MSDKPKYGGEVWFVRGVPPALRAEVAAAAERAGMKVGPWVERALRAALEGVATNEAPPVSRAGAPSGPGASDDLARQVADLEERIAFLRPMMDRLTDAEEFLRRLMGLAENINGRVKALEQHPASPLASPAKAEAVAPQASEETGEVFVHQEGKRRKLTPAGIAEAERLIRDGVKDIQIARRIGVERGAIRQRRLKLAGENVT